MHDGNPVFDRKTSPEAAQVLLTLGRDAFLSLTRENGVPYCWRRGFFRFPRDYRPVCLTGWAEGKASDRPVGPKRVLWEKNDVMNSGDLRTTTQSFTTSSTKLVSNLPNKHPPMVK
uniref:DUF1738 domain-containing protein n=1 Tax=Angiostrongylus cantonensis TaxID=6313 RepID=A0A0K0DF86_ANGCA